MFYAFPAAAVAWPVPAPAPRPDCGRGESHDHDLDQEGLLASGIAAVIGLTACSAGSSPSGNSGGLPAPVTLTLGVPDSQGTPAESADITSFARLVRQLSDGRMTIRIMWEVTQAANPERPGDRGAGRRRHRGPGLDRRAGLGHPGGPQPAGPAGPVPDRQLPAARRRAAQPDGQRHARRARPGRVHRAGPVPRPAAPSGRVPQAAGVAAGDCGARGSGSRHRGPPRRCSARWARCRCT